MKTRIKRVLTQMVSVGGAALILLFLIEAPASGFTGSGAGTVADPYQITNSTQLQEMQDNLNAHYILVNDIDCSDTATGAGFEPVGGFTGTLDGQNYVITVLYINRPSTYYVGLFGSTGSAAEIKNVGLVDVDITGNWYVGGLVAYNSGTITKSYAIGSVSGNYCVGGLVGQNGYKGTITNSYATGNVTGFSGAGGLVGTDWYGTITNSYATGNVTGNYNVGGLAGSHYGHIKNSYATGNVTGGYAGGLVGRNYGPIINCYYNNHAGNPNSGVGYNYGTGYCIPIQDNESYFYYSSNPPMSSWDFVNVWGIDEGVSHPYLLWQIPPAIPAFIDIDPDTLNLKRKGRWITCYIWLPEDYNVADIEPDSIFLEDEIEAAWMWFDEKEQVAMAKFSRSEVQDILEPNEAVELTVSGELTDGTEFEGTDTIRVIGPIIPPFAIKRLKVKIGKSAGEDSISISGTIDALIRRIAGATSIDITIKAADDSIVYSESIPFSADSMKKGKLNYKNKVGKGEPGAITKFSLNLVKHTFSMGARNIDLSGLTYPLTLEIVIGTYSASAQAG